MVALRELSCLIWVHLRRKDMLFNTKYAKHETSNSCQQVMYRILTSNITLKAYRLLHVHYFWSYKAHGLMRCTAEVCSPQNVNASDSADKPIKHVCGKKKTLSLLLPLTNPRWQQTHPELKKNWQFWLIYFVLSPTNLILLAWEVDEGWVWVNLCYSIILGV